MENRTERSGASSSAPEKTSGETPPDEGPNGMSDGQTPLKVVNVTLEELAMRVLRSETFVTVVDEVVNVLVYQKLQSLLPMALEAALQQPYILEPMCVKCLCSKMTYGVPHGGPGDLWVTQARCTNCLYVQRICPVPYNPNAVTRGELRDVHGHPLPANESSAAPGGPTAAAPGGPTSAASGEPSAAPGEKDEDPVRSLEDELGFEL